MISTRWRRLWRSGGLGCVSKGPNAECLFPLNLLSIEKSLVSSILAKKMPLSSIFATTKGKKKNSEEEGGDEKKAQFDAFPLPLRFFAMRPYLLKGHSRPLTQLKCVLFSG